MFGVEKVARHQPCAEAQSTRRFDEQHGEIPAGAYAARICRRAALSIVTFAIGALMARWIASMTRSTRSVASRPNARPLTGLFPDHPERPEADLTKRMTASGRLEIQSGHMSG